MSFINLRSVADLFRRKRKLPPAAGAPYYATLASAIVNENGLVCIYINASGVVCDKDGNPLINELLPSQTGQNGKVLGTNGNVTAWVAGGGIGGTTGTTDNAIARADGTVGSTLQGGVTNPPTYDDAGLMSVIGGINSFSPILIGSSGTIGFNGFFNPATGAADLIILRDAANTLAQRNGANAQTLNVYNTFTDGSNYERLVITAIDADFGSNVFSIRTKNAGTGQLRDLAIGGQVTAFLSGGGNVRWKIDSTGHFLAQSDNTYDIGASGATRPRTIYAATSVLAPNIPVVDTGWTANADGGSKTVIIGSSASNATIGTALDLVTSGAGTLLKNTAEKVKALEAALVALLLPNA